MLHCLVPSVMPFRQNAVQSVSVYEQALASSPAAVQHLRQVAASDDNVPLASAISECLDALVKPSSPPRNGSISPRSVLDAFRYVSTSHCALCYLLMRAVKLSDWQDSMAPLYKVTTCYYTQGIPPCRLSQRRRAERFCRSLGASVWYSGLRVCQTSLNSWQSFAASTVIMEIHLLFAVSKLK